MNEKLNSRIHRHRFQLLAVHPGQHRRGGVGREGREFGQDVRPRSRRAGAAVEIAQDRACQGAGRRQPGGVQPARPAQSRGADRSRQGGALRLLGRRHQHGGAGGDRRPGGDARLRGRDQLRARPCGWRRAIATTSTPSARSRSPCRTAIRRATPAYIALERRRRRAAGDRRRLHLSREQPALHSAEIQRARARSRLDRGRGAGARRRERAAAAGLPHGMVGRVRRACRRPRSGSRSSCRSA